jgi:hypothetical protein
MDRGLDTVPGSPKGAYPRIEQQIAEEIGALLQDPSIRTDLSDRKLSAVRAGRHPVTFDIRLQPSGMRIFCGDVEIGTVDAALRAYRGACRSAAAVPGEAGEARQAEIPNINAIRLKLYRGIRGFEGGTYEDIFSDDDV